ncbi:MAG TPA: thioredoxin domain-containing protein [Gallionella sp.]|nr:thioredoxin domain-containing protein [Gallionella sp.]
MPNQLSNETSPYLQQHADNPVDWHAWSPGTLQLARELDKPILLSIGYSACHWCHVMAHESFEDINVAAVMNEHFINIKVDREERPDLDHIYQTAHQLLTRRNGGWPLTMFLSPDGTPFFGGTYFPKEARYNLPAFPELLDRVAEVYHDQREELAAQGQHLIAALAGMLPVPGRAGAAPDDQPLNVAVKQHLENFDPVNGGFGGAPKFLHPAELDLLLRRSRATDNAQAAHVVHFTLQQMAHGGLYDQLGGGFCRYSVDERWDIPHFEKMLYDNGLLLGLYCGAWQDSSDPLFARVVEQTAAWVMREMQSGEGGYYSSLDADSEHEEGKFYVWQRDEIRALLSDDEYALIAPYYSLDRPANFENHAWNLRISAPLQQIALQLGLAEARAIALLDSAREKLLAVRGQRIRPGRDEKILAAWNGLMIAGMARAARVFDRPDWLHSAQQAMDFVRATLWRNGKLLATYKDGKAHLNAYLDDHAFLLSALLELLQAEYRSVDLAFAVQLADALLERFEDKQDGGFFFTSHDHEVLIQRNKIGTDNATPAGNGIAAQALLRLAELTGKNQYAQAAERCLKLFFPALQQAAGYHSSLCAALAEYLQPCSLLVLRGTGDDTAAWQNKLRACYLPAVMTIVLADDADGLPDTLDKPRSGRTTAWLCHGTQCLAPITDPGELLAALA